MAHVSEVATSICESLERLQDPNNPQLTIKWGWPIRPGPRATPADGFELRVFFERSTSLDDFRSPMGQRTYWSVWAYVPRLTNTAPSGQLRMEEQVATEILSYAQAALYDTRHPDAMGAVQIDGIQVKNAKGYVDQSTEGSGCASIVFHWDLDLGDTLESMRDRRALGVVEQIMLELNIQPFDETETITVPTGG